MLSRIFCIVAENRRVIILGDSIIKNMPSIDDVIIKSFRGDNIARLTSRINGGEVNLSPFDYIIVHVWTVTRRFAPKTFPPLSFPP